MTKELFHQLLDELLLVLDVDVDGGVPHVPEVFENHFQSIPPQKLGRNDV